MAKMLHPANGARFRAAPDEAEVGPDVAPVRVEPEGPVIALYDEDSCRARLESATEGALSHEGRGGQLLKIAAVEGPDVLLVTTGGGAHQGHAAHGQTRTLQVTGLTDDGCRWVVRATGTVQALISANPSSPARRTRRPPAGSRQPHPDWLDLGDFALFSLTVTTLRGYQASGDRPEAGGGATPPP
jgi:hypothetical protein